MVEEVPKALVQVAGQPFLHHQLQLLAGHGASRVILCIGYRGDQIRASVGDGSAFGLDVSYSEDGPELIGTAGAVRKALPLLGDRFFVLYGDTFLRIDYAEVGRAAAASELPALMTVLRNGGQWDASNAEYANGRVLRYDKINPSPEWTWIDYGLNVLTPEAMAFGAGLDRDLAALCSRLASHGLLAGYEATERFYEVGTPDALAEAGAFLERWNAHANRGPEVRRGTASSGSTKTATTSRRLRSI
jgi:NDP-sugar pyrophosphorylase family protein